MYFDIHVFVLRFDDGNDAETEAKIEAANLH